MVVTDTLSRALSSLRLSVTDRCNLRCRYCMPDDDYVWIPRQEILSFEEICILVDAFVGLGARRLRLTGGEPLLRHNVAGLVRMLASRDRIEDLALTTNGLLLRKLARPLAEAGLDRVTVSLDTLRHDRYRTLTRREGLDDVWAGIETVRQAGLRRTKINMVVMRGVNEDELADVLEFGKAVAAEVRFIEYMDVGGATDWSAERVVSRREILGLLSSQYGRIVPAGPADRGLSDSAPADRNREWDHNSSDPGLSDRSPADRFRLPDGTVFGVIASMTQPFCRTCDRSRLTADGRWYRCLYAQEGMDLKSPLRGGATPEAIADLLRQAWRERTDTGAEDRVRVRVRGPLLSADRLRRDPHLEMHTRGG